MTSLLPNSRRSDVSFCPDGRIDITARIAKSLKLAKGDVIDVASHNDEYLLYVRRRAADCVGMHAGTVYPTKAGITAANNFRTYSKPLCDAVCTAAGKEKGSHLRLPAGQPFLMEPYGTVIPLITRNPL